MAEINGRPTNVVVNTSTLQNAASALGNGTPLPVNSGDAVTLVTTGGGSVSSTVAYEADYLNAVGTFTAVSMTLLGTLGVASTSALINTTPIQLTMTVPPGMNSIRARVSVFATGTVTVIAYVTPKV